MKFIVFSCMLALALVWIFVPDSQLGLRGLASGGMSMVFGPDPKKYTGVNMKLSIFICFR